MKILSYRSSMPFDNRGTGDSPSISPATSKSVIPCNNVPTIQDIIENKINFQRDYNPHSGGDWADGEDVDKSFKEQGDDYKRQERDLGILNFMMQYRDKFPQKWTVRVPGGTKTFMSFDLASQFVRDKNLPFISIQRVAQNVVNPQEHLRIDVISESLGKTFMVESVNPSKGVQETGAAFCVAPTYFITCAHVLKSYNKNAEVPMDHFMDAIINLIDGNQKAEAHVVSVDPKLDIALLRCNIESGVLALDPTIQIGADIIAIGSPHGYDNNVSSGTIGSLDRKIYSYNGAPNYMFVDLSVFPGNSGGPVIKVDNGKVAGMVTLIVASTGGFGLNASLPASYIVDFCRKNIKNFSA